MEVATTTKEEETEVKEVIEDLFFILINDTHTVWKNLIQDYSGVGILKRETNDSSTKTDFLYPILTMSKGMINLKTFQKVITSYLYIPPHSAHLPDVTHGIIFGILTRYSGFMKFMNLFF